MKKPLKCDHRDRVQLHPSIKIGGFAIGRCERDALPGMVVCAWHATPDAITIQMNQLALRTKGL